MNEELSSEGLSVGPADKPYSAPGRSAEHDNGVLYQGEFETPWDGTGTAVRLHARALAAQGVPLLLRSFSNVVVNADGVAEPVHIAGIPEQVMAEVGHLIDASIRTFRPVIKHAVLRGAEHLRQIIMPRGAIPEHDDIESLVKMKNEIYGNTILYTVWERDRIDSDIQKHLKRVAEVWVPCQHNAEMLIANGVTSVCVVPHPFDEKDNICKLVNRRPREDGWARFYSIGRWEPRKGFDELIGAFLTAFRPGDKATLTIKYSGGQWQNYVTPEDAIKDWVVVTHEKNRWTEESAKRHITLIGGKLPRSRILEQHFVNNIYVSASHGEAWNLPAYEAKVAGNAMVHVPWGGTADYADPDRDCMVPYTIGPVHASYGWERDARWASYEVDDLANELRRAALEFAWTLEAVPFRRPPGFEERFSQKAVGKLMLDRVNEVLKGTSLKYGEQK